MPAHTSGTGNGQGVQALVDEAVKVAHDRGAPIRADLPALLQQYYRFVAPEDLAGVAPAVS